jgi:hypothetical protein
MRWKDQVAITPNTTRRGSAVPASGSTLRFALSLDDLISGNTTLQRYERPEDKIPSGGMTDIRASGPGGSIVTALVRWAT